MRRERSWSFALYLPSLATLRSGRLLLAKSRRSSTNSRTAASSCSRTRTGPRDFSPAQIDIYTHLFERARRAADLRAAVAGSPFAHVLAQATATEPWLEKGRSNLRRIGRRPANATPGRVPALVARIVNVEYLTPTCLTRSVPGGRVSFFGILPISSGF